MTFSRDLGRNATQIQQRWGILWITRMITKNQCFNWESSRLYGFLKRSSGAALGRKRGCTPRSRRRRRWCISLAPLCGWTVAHTEIKYADVAFASNATAIASG